MRSILLGFCLASLVLSGCGGNPMAKVKGTILENGKPKSFPPTSHSVEIAPVDASGQVDHAKAFSAVVNGDGSFEVVASGGQLPVGTYQFSIRGPGSGKKGIKVGPAPGAKRDLQPGDIAITLDIAKPTE
jgi:hypothetical protein